MSLVNYENIGQKLNEIFDKLANANSPKLDKVFDDLDFANKDKFPNETLQRLINHFSQYNFGNTYISSDILGDAYEYLIKQFAAAAGKKAGEFYSPREVERVIIQVVQPHKKDHIYDPTVGSGGFLLEAFHHLKEKESAAIVDIRTPSEFKAWHIENSLNISLEDLEEKIGQANKETILCCEGGMESYLIALKLTEKGYQNIRFVDGGINFFKNI